jgi:intracellular septation protein
MKFLFDLFPVVLFFVTYKTMGMYWATGVLMAASVVQIAAVYLRGKKPEAIHLITVGLALPLGAMTLLFHDKHFIMWKPTVANAALAGVFVVTGFIGDRTTMAEKMLGSAMKLPAVVWRKVNTAWACFFLFTGALNLVVAYNFAESTWVNFKLFGLTGLTMVFVVVQTFFLQKYLIEEKKPAAPAEPGA